MDLTAAIAAIQNCNELPNRAEVLATLNSELDKGKNLQTDVERLTQNNADLLKQKSAKAREVERLQKELSDVLKAAGAEGETTEQQLGKIKELLDAKTTLEAQIKTLQDEKQGESDRAVAAEKKAAEIERSLNNQKAGLLLKADVNAIGRLINLPLEIEGESVFVQDGDTKTDFKEYVKAQGEWMERALFPTATTTETPPTEPTTPPNPKPSNAAPSAPPSQPPEKKSTVGSYLATAGFNGVKKKGEG